MLKICGRKDTKRGGLITEVTEWDVWDVVLDDDGAEAVPNVSSLIAPVVVSAVETATNTWTVTLSDFDSTVITGLTKTGAVGITSATIDAGEDSGVWDVVLNSKGYVSGFDAVTPVVAGYLAFDINDEDTPSTNQEPNWEYIPATEFAKYLKVCGG